MKLLNIGLMLAFNLTIAAGMGSKSNPATIAEDKKILPESTRPSSPSVVNTPVRLIENTAEENKKVDEAFKVSAPSVDVKAAITKVPKKTKVSVAKKKKAAAAPKSKAKTIKKS